MRCGKERFKVESLIIFDIFVRDDDIFYLYFSSGLRMGCSKDEFSCADGGCVSWALTCNGEKDCEDGTDEPLFCKKRGEPSIWENNTTTATKNKQNTVISKMRPQILCDSFLLDDGMTKNLDR